MKNKTLTKLFTAMQRSKGLPAIESTVNSILNMLYSTEEDMDSLITAVTDDVAITQRVLSLVNSDMYAPFMRDVSTVSDAVNIIGQEALNYVVGGSSLITKKDKLIGPELEKTKIASEISRTMASDAKMEETSIASLLFNLGNLIITKYLPEELKLIDDKIKDGTLPKLAEIEVLGMTPTEIGITVAKNWKFPVSIISVLDGSGDSSVISIAQASSSISEHIHSGDFDAAEKFVNELKIAGLDKTKMNAVIKDKNPEHIPVAIKELTLKQENALNDLLSEIKKYTGKNIDELAKIVFSSFADILKTDHCFLFVLNLAGDYKIYTAYGRGADEIKSKFKVTAELKPTAFHAVIQKNVDILISNVKQLKTSSTPVGYKELLPDVTKFIILPIFNNHVSGLLYCDWETITTELTSVELDLIRKIRDVFVPLFPKK